MTHRPHISSASPSPFDENHGEGEPGSAISRQIQYTFIFADYRRSHLNILRHRRICVISDHHELELVIAALRRNNYTLFANAVATSDLSYTLSTRNYASFTLFAPPDPYLFALDMVSSFHDYVRAIDLHVVHRRLPLAALVESDYLETILPHHHLYVVKHEVSLVYDGGPIAVGGVRISTPDLFLGYSIAVHGLDGMIASAILSNEPAFVQWWCPYSSEQYFQNLNVNSKLVNVSDEEGINAEKNHSHFSKF